MAAGVFLYAGCVAAQTPGIDDVPTLPECRIECEKVEGKITKFRCKYFAQKAPRDRNVTFTWQSPADMKDNRVRTAVMAAHNVSVYDERYLAGRGTGAWTISVEDAGKRCQAVYAVDKQRNVYAMEGVKEKAEEAVTVPQTPEKKQGERDFQDHPPVEEPKAPPVRNVTEDIKPKTPAARRSIEAATLQKLENDDHTRKTAAVRSAETCGAEGLTTEVVRKNLNEVMLRIKTRREFVELKMASETFDRSLTLYDVKGNDYTAIRYAEPGSVLPATVLATACNGKVLLSPRFSGYEKIGHDKLSGFDESAGTALCNTMPSEVSKTYKPSIFRVTGIKGEAVELEELSLGQSVALKPAQEKYREYFKKVSTNMSVALFMENIHLNGYFARLPEHERAFCRALYEEKDFEELIPLFSVVNP